MDPGGGSSSGSSAVEARVVLLCFGWQEHWWRQQGRQCACCVHQALAVLGQALYGVGSARSVGPAAAAAWWLCVTEWWAACGQHGGLVFSSW